MSIIEYIINKLGPNDIEVILNIDQVIFKCGDAIECLAPIVYLSQDSIEYRVLAVGNVPEISEKSIRINLFDSQGFDFLNFDKAAVLERFFEYGINKMMGRLAFVRPRVKLVFGDRISKVFGGYEKIVLRETVVNAGAREVVFSPTQ